MFHRKPAAPPPVAETKADEKPSPAVAKAPVKSILRRRAAHSRAGRDRTGASGSRAGCSLSGCTPCMEETDEPTFFGDDITNFQNIVAALVAAAATNEQESQTYSDVETDVAQQLVNSFTTVSASTFSPDLILFLNAVANADSVDPATVPGFTAALAALSQTYITIPRANLRFLATGVPPLFDSGFLADPFQPAQPFREPKYEADYQDPLLRSSLGPASDGVDQTGDDVPDILTAEPCCDVCERPIRGPQCNDCGDFFVQPVCPCGELFDAPPCFCDRGPRCGCGRPLEGDVCAGCDLFTADPACPCRRVFSGPLCDCEPIRALPIRDCDCDHDCDCDQVRIQPIRGPLRDCECDQVRIQPIRGPIRSGPFGCTKITTADDAGDCTDNYISVDLNGDGRSDLTILDQNNDDRIDAIFASFSGCGDQVDLTALDQDSNGTIDYLAADMAGTGRKSLVAQDLNGDGFMDSVSLNFNGSGQPQVLVMDTNNNGCPDFIGVQDGCGGMINLLAPQRRFFGGPFRGRPFRNGRLRGQRFFGDPLCNDPCDDRFFVDPICDDSCGPVFGGPVCDDWGFDFAPYWGDGLCDAPICEPICGSWSSSISCCDCGVCAVCAPVAVDLNCDGFADAIVQQPVGYWRRKRRHHHRHHHGSSSSSSSGSSSSSCSSSSSWSWCEPCGPYAYGAYGVGYGAYGAAVAAPFYGAGYGAYGAGYGAAVAAPVYGAGYGAAVAAPAYGAYGAGYGAAAAGYDVGYAAGVVADDYQPMEPAPAPPPQPTDGGGGRGPVSPYPLGSAGPGGDVAAQVPGIRVY